MKTADRSPRPGAIKSGRPDAKANAGTSSTAGWRSSRGDLADDDASNDDHELRCAATQYKIFLEHEAGLLQLRLDEERRRAEAARSRIVADRQQREIERAKSESALRRAVTTVMASPVKDAAVPRLRPVTVVAASAARAACGYSESRRDRAADAIRPAVLPAARSDILK